MNLRLIDEPRMELLEAVGFYKAIDKTLGQRFDFEADSCLQRISSAPEHFRIRRGDYRRINLEDFPYFTPFVVRGNDLWILAFAHVSRKPHYWILRKKQSARNAVTNGIWVFGFRCRVPSDAVLKFHVVHLQRVLMYRPGAFSIGAFPSPPA